jgi:hypothetical protein
LILGHFFPAVQYEGQVEMLQALKEIFHQMDLLACFSNFSEPLASHSP